jgi:threonylcarbamoyladenosine tRNA methylthiotransferase MtaB
MSENAPQVVTFGCRLNTYESEVMRTHAQNAGLQDVIIFNTCAVTKEAERQARQSIRRARKENPNAKIIVTGCSAQIAPEIYAAMPEVSHVIGNDLKLKPETWNLNVGTTTPPDGQTFDQFGETRVMVNDIMSVKDTANHLVEGFEGRARAFIQVQNGCDHRCTFCIIPYGRGNSRSVPIGEIVAQVRALVTAGYNEIVMTGVDITSYGADLPGTPTLGQMIRRTLALVPELPRLRLSSLDPVEMDDDLWHLIGHEPRLMPHLHMSLQAGDDMILKRMKRRHLRADAIDMCKRARTLRPDIVFGADIIAGFPTETDDMFQNTLSAVEDCDLTFLHIFPYSERPGTPAAKMPQVPVDVRKDRAAKLRVLGEQQVQKFLKSQIGQSRMVVMERDDRGHTEHFAPVALTEKQSPGSLVRVRIDNVSHDHLIGVVQS